VVFQCAALEAEAAVKAGAVGKGRAAVRKARVVV
jgi:hypothetical protein